MYGPPLSPAEEATFWQTRQPALYATIGVFLVIVNILIPARLYINFKIHWKQYGLLTEDVFAMLSLLFVDAIFANLLVATWYGLGLHDWTVNALDPQWPKNISDSFRHIWITMVLMSAYLCSVKCMLLFFYKRLFLVSGKALRIAWWVNLIYLALWFIGATCFYLFQCSPVEWYWMQYYPKYGKPTPGGMKGDCKATDVRHVALPLIFSLISDFAVLFLPLWAISKLHATARRKSALSFVFGIGLMACLLELARILELIYDTNDKSDATWGVAIFLILTAAEETAVIFCATFPVVGPRLYKMVKGRRSSKYTTSYRPSQPPISPSFKRSWRRSRPAQTLNFLNFGAHNQILQTGDMSFLSQAQPEPTHRSMSDRSSATQVGERDDERYKEEERIGCDPELKPLPDTETKADHSFLEPPPEVHHKDYLYSAQGQETTCESPRQVHFPFRISPRPSNHALRDEFHGSSRRPHLPFHISPRHSNPEPEAEDGESTHEIHVRTSIDVTSRPNPHPHPDPRAAPHFQFPSS